MIGDFTHECKFSIGNKAIAVFVGMSEHTFDFVFVDVFGKVHHYGPELQ